MRRFLILLTLLVIFPIIEIFVLISIGRVIGAGWTILLVLGTSALGAWLLKREGAKSFQSFRADVQAGRPPGNTVTEGLLVLAGGAFMLVPGFVSDVIGALLIFPPTRKLARIALLAGFGQRLAPDTATTLFGPRTVQARAGTAYPGDARAGQDPRRPASTEPGGANGPAIEGEIIDP